MAQSGAGRGPIAVDHNEMIRLVLACFKPLVVSIDLRLAGSESSAIILRLWNSSQPRKGTFQSSCSCPLALAKLNRSDMPRALNA